VKAKEMEIHFYTLGRDEDQPKEYFSFFSSLTLI